MKRLEIIEEVDRWDPMDWAPVPTLDVGQPGAPMASVLNVEDVRLRLNVTRPVTQFDEESWMLPASGRIAYHVDVFYAGEIVAEVLTFILDQDRQCAVPVPAVHRPDIAVSPVFFYTDWHDAAGQFLNLWLFSDASRWAIYLNLQVEAGLEFRSTPGDDDLDSIFPDE